MKDFGEIDIELLKRFNQPGPRYTSYPTAPVFSQEFTAADYEKEVLDTNEHDDSSPISLYFHFPFCEKLCYFCGCNMLVTHDRKAIATYNDYLKREIEPPRADDLKASQGRADALWRRHAFVSHARRNPRYWKLYQVEI